MDIDSWPMKSWRQAARDSLVPGLLAGLAVTGAAVWRGRADGGSAVAPLNATSHVFCGERAACAERATLRHPALGVGLSLISAVFWAAVFEKLFGRLTARHGPAAALLGAGTTAGLDGAGCTPPHGG